MDNGYPVEEMDFPEKKIYLIAETKFEKTHRVHACAKEPFTVDWIRNTAHKGILYDIGANVGSYSLVAASLMSGNDAVVSFEPSYFNFYRLNENILINKLSNRVIPLHMALGNKNTFIPINFPVLDFGLSVQASETRGSGFTTNVICMTLDMLTLSGCIPFPNHIKIDVDGDEAAILEGGAKTLYDTRLKSLLIETDEKNTAGSEKINNLLTQAGLNCVERYPLMTKGLYNVLFAR